MRRNGWTNDEYARWRAYRVRDFIQTHGREPTAEEWKQLSVFTQADLDKRQLDMIAYAPDLPYSKFKSTGSYNTPLYLQRPITVFDIEANDAQKPISISAVKFALNKKTGDFEVIDTYQRFYRERPGMLEESYKVHGLSARALGKLRDTQFKSGVPKYGRIYNEKEAASFKNFLGNSIISGHNIVEYDLQHLFPKEYGISIQNQTIDTLIASRNLFGERPGLRHGLADVFKKFTGKTMEQAGLPHHDAMSDTLATAIVLNKMLKLNDGAPGSMGVGESLRSILKYPGTSLGYKDEMLSGPQMIVLGGPKQLRMTGAEALKYYMSRKQQKTYDQWVADQAKQRQHDATRAEHDLMEADNNDRGPEFRKLDEYLEESGFQIENIASGSLYDAGNDSSYDSTAQELLMQTVAQLSKLQHSFSGMNYMAQQMQDVARAQMVYVKPQIMAKMASVPQEEMRDVALGLGIKNPEDLLHLEVGAVRIREENQFKREVTNLRRMYRDGYMDTPAAAAIYERIKHNAGGRMPEVEQLLSEDLSTVQFRHQDKLDIAYAKGLLRDDQYDELRKDVGLSAFNVNLNSTIASNKESERIQREGAKVYEREQREALKLSNLWDHRDQRIDIAGINGGLSGAEMRRLRDAVRSSDFEVSLAKERKLHSAVRKGYITPDQADEMRMITDNEELADALDKAATSTEKFTAACKAVTSIPMYDFERWSRAAESQASGVLRSARGVVPNWMLDPTSSFVNAGFNSFNRWASPFRTFGNAAVNVLGPGIGMALGGVPGAMIGAGVAKAGSQFLGAAVENQIQQKGYAIQEKFNTIGGIISWVSTPFKLLGRVAKTLAHSFLGLNLQASNLMKQGLGDMSHMGNPLTSLTGVSMTDYQGATMLDKAAFLSTGTVNSTIEDFALQQREFFTLGKVNTDRMIASTMLGVFDKVYSADPNADKGEQYYDMVNSILARGVDPTTLGWAAKIDSALPQLLQTAQNLGVTDIRDLANPSRRGLYWEPLKSDERKAFTEDQYEWGVAQQGFTNTKMRFADRVWRTFGKDISFGLSKALDLAVEGDFKGSFDTIKDVFSTVKDTVTDLWSTIKGEMGWEGDGSIKSWFKDNIWEPLKTSAGEALREWTPKLKDMVIRIYDIWDGLVRDIIARLSSMIQYLSTVKFDWKKLMAGENPVSFIGSETYDKDDIFWQTKGGIARSFLKDSWAVRSLTYDRSGQVTGSSLSPVGERPWKRINDIYTAAQEVFRDGKSLVFRAPNNQDVDVHNMEELDSLLRIMYAHYEKGYSAEDIYSWVDYKDLAWSERGKAYVNQKANTHPGAAVEAANALLDYLNESTRAALPGNNYGGHTEATINVNLLSDGKNKQPAGSFDLDLGGSGIPRIQDVTFDAVIKDSAIGR